MALRHCWRGTALLIATLAGGPASMLVAAQQAGSAAPVNPPAVNPPAVRWAQLSAEGKLLYAAGLLDGALLVRSTLMPSGPAADRERAVDRNVAPRLSPEKLRSGIDAFFKEPLNRNINVPQAATVVLLTASGATPAVIDSALQTFRKVAPASAPPGGAAPAAR